MADKQDLEKQEIELVEPAEPLSEPALKTSEENNAVASNKNDTDPQAGFAAWILGENGAHLQSGSIGLQSIQRNYPQGCCSS